MLLFADIFETIVGSLFLILWIAGQLLGARKGAKQKKKAPRPQPQQQWPQQPQPMGMAEGDPQPQMQGPRNQEEALRSEVEDFLRRAQGKPPKPQPTLDPVVKRQTPRPQRSKPQRSKPRRPRPQQQQTSTPVEVRTLRSEGVAEHVTRHLSTQDIAEHTEALGADVATADDRLESHLQEKFGHQLGSLQHRDSLTETRPAEEKTRKADMAADIAAMLRSPQGMRQLIVASEILRRPEW